MQMTDKAALRSLMKQKRAELSAGERAAADEHICRRVLASRPYAECSELLVYVSSGTEVSTEGIISAALAAGKRVFCPRCLDSSGIMSFYRVMSTDDLESGSFGIMEPASHCAEYLPEGKALCITPALAYDRRGNRLGYGRGYYDRFLSGFEGFILGIGYDSSVTDSLFGDSYDVPVDMIITENREIITVDE